MTHGTCQAGLDSGITSANVGVQALGDGVADRAARFSCNSSICRCFFSIRRVDPPRLPVQKGGDGALFL